ncbi:MAG: S1 RNA-binding domain-containing protein [Lachnospiraceae bacterium]|jgi:small subunit ribosomal protein S1|nr:S1 RNA-binding domain-containing protein [Lachnospiraceae bacterium]
MESMENFEAMLEASFRQVHNGDLVEGTILQVSGDSAVVDIGSYMDGILTQDQLLYDGQTMAEYPEGTKLMLMVLRVDSRSSQILLSKKEADKIVVWDELEQKRENGESITVKVKAAVKGGLRIQYQSVQGFMPASQVSDHYMEDLAEYAGQELEALILEINREKRDFTVSHRELLRQAEKAAKAHALHTLQSGDRRQGKVVKLEKYGAFIELERGVIGLLHVSDMAWTRVKHPSEMLQIGDDVTVVVQEVDAERGRISLSLKAVGENPWMQLPFEVGDVLMQKPVTHMIASGAFVQLTPELEGFLPISQISEKRIQTVREVLKEGDLVNVLVRSTDPENRRISLSMRDVEQGEEISLAEGGYEQAEEEVTSSLGQALAGLDWEE